jgi:hypothetical protein
MGSVQETLYKIDQPITARVHERQIMQLLIKQQKTVVTIFMLVKGIILVAVRTDLCDD